MFVPLFFAICVVSSGFCGKRIVSARMTHVGAGARTSTSTEPILLVSPGRQPVLSVTWQVLHGTTNGQHEREVNGRESYFASPGVQEAVIHQMKWPSPSGPVEPHPERLASEMLPSPERATSDASAGEGVAETRAAEVTRARMVEKRIVNRGWVVVKASGEWWVFDVAEEVWVTGGNWQGRRGFYTFSSPQDCA